MPDPTTPHDLVARGTDATGDNSPTDTAPDPESPLRTPAADVLDAAPAASAPAASAPEAATPDAPAGTDVQDAAVRSLAVVTEATVGEGTVDRVIQGHTYDGIREYDNPMPGWWIALFWAGILFAPVYMLGIHVFGTINTYQDDFAEAGARLEAVRTAYAATGPSFKTDAGALRAYAGDAQLAAAGAAHFAAICAACHGAQGQGVIGPNLTDTAWLHGGTAHEVWESIATGFPAKGMPPMSAQLSPEERAQAMAYVFSLQGSNPPGAKPAEGEVSTGI